LVGVLQHVVGHVSAPAPQKAAVNHSLLYSTAGHPDGWRTAHSAQTYQDHDTVRWSKWDVVRVQSLGDGVSGTWYCFVCTACTVCTKCAQRTSVHSLLQECTIKTIQLQVCTKCMKISVKTIIYVFLVYTWAKSRQSIGDTLHPSQSALEACSVLQTGLLYSHDPWAGRLGVQQHVVGHCSPQKAVVMM
jgi:hypothetical protein